jgi:protoheme ferro-lyase
MRSASLPQSERAHRHGILLPLYPQMTAETQLEVVEALRDAMRAARAAARPARAWRDDPTPAQRWIRAFPGPPHSL